MNKINTEKLIEMLLYGAEILSKKSEEINALNVFPVPDGDTGSNMNMTMQSAVKSVTDGKFQTVSGVATAVSKGMLMGARGNSGVILSQFFRGINEELKESEELTIEKFHKALKQGKKRAYKSVINAVEGTILTVIKDMSEYKPESKEFDVYFKDVVNVGNQSLENTPNLLPVLKEVGVVDSGGAGLMAIFDGMLASLQGKKIEIKKTTSFETFQKTEEHPMKIEDITFGYCTEMLVRLKKEIQIEEVIKFLETMGDSIVAINDEDILKVHVHTEEPVKIFEYGQSLGDFIHVKSENMRIQVEEAHGKKEEKENGIVVVASSKEMASLYSDIQEVEVIVGGQTLNPSTEDIVKAVKATNAKNVLFFPNNSNIIMAAKSAKELITDANLEIIETKHMTQALECLINYNNTLTIKENQKNMTDILKKITNIEITNAIKDTSIEGVNINKNDFLIIKDGKIVASEQKLDKAFKIIITLLEVDELEVVNVLIGKDGTKSDIQNFIENLESENEFLEIETYKTNQPVYSYLISGIKE